jgi:hypothetical protein
MFSRILSVSAAVVLTVALPAVALDLERMSSHDKRIYCVAYTHIDLQMRYEAGAVDKAAYDHQRMQIGWKIQNRGDNYNYAGDFRKLDKAIQDIVAENPPMDAFAAQAAACRSYLRL